MKDRRRIRVRDRGVKMVAQVACKGVGERLSGG